MTGAGVNDRVVWSVGIIRRDYMVVSQGTRVKEAGTHFRKEAEAVV